MKKEILCFCIDCVFKKFEPIDKKELSDLLRNLNYI